VLTWQSWQRPWSRSPSGLREETDLHRLDEDLVRVVSETLPLDAARACFFFPYRGPLKTLNPSRNVATPPSPPGGIIVI
jgi:hypothetical protein